MKVAKFGGSSVKDASAMKRCAEIICAQDDLTIVVVSATQNTTNELELIAATAKRGDIEAASSLVDHLKLRHENILNEINSDINIAEISNILKEADPIIKRMALKKAFDKEDMDSLYCLGERMSSFIISKLLELKSDKEVLLRDAREFIKTDSNFCAALAQVDKIKEAVEKKLLSDVNKKTLIVTQGFIGSDHKGRNTTLGREGSDYTATLVAEAIGADEVQIWTDVAGVATFDPRMLEKTKFIAELSYEEASTLALLGAKILYPKTLFPAKRQNITVFVGSTLEPEAPGTRIHNDCKKYVGPRALSFLKKSEGNLLSLIGNDLEMLEIPYKKVGESTVSRSYLVADEDLDEALNTLHKIVLDHF